MPRVDNEPWITEQTAKRLADELPNAEWLAVQTLKAEGKAIPPFLQDVPEETQERRSEGFLENIKDPAFARRRLAEAVYGARLYVEYQRRNRQIYRPKSR